MALCWVQRLTGSDLSSLNGDSRLMTTPAIWKDEATLRALHLVQRDGSTIGKRLLADDVKSQPDNDAIFALYCGCLLWTGERPLAEQLLSERIALRPSASTYATLAVAQRMSDDKELSLESIKISGSIDESDYLYLRHASDIATVEGDDDTFERLMSLAEQLYPGDPWVYSKRITHSLARSHPDEARRILESAPDSFRTLSMFHHQWGMVYLHERNLESMEEQFRYAVAMSPETAQYWSYLSMALRHQSKFDEAISAADHALDLDPTSRFALETHLKAAERRGDKASAKSYAARLAASMPGIDNPRAREANKLVQEGNYKGAIAIHLKTLKDPDLSDFNRKSTENTLLFLYSLHGMWIDSRKLLTKLQSEQRVIGDRINVYLAETDFYEGVPGALDRLEAMASVDHPASTVLLALVRAYLKVGQREKLVQMVDRICLDTPPDVTALAHAVLALDQAGEQAMAHAMYETIRRRRPNLAALRYFEIGEAARFGDIDRARRLNRDLPSGERITLKSIIKAKIRKLFG